VLSARARALAAESEEETGGAAWASARLEQAVRIAMVYGRDAKRIEAACEAIRSHDGEVEETGAERILRP
jgi:hypothetical protein